MSELFCGACGTKYALNDKFCGKCGNERKITEIRPTQIDLIDKPADNVEVLPDNTPDIPTDQTPTESTKKLLTKRRIIFEINIIGTFLWAIILLVIGIVCIYATSIHTGLAIIGAMLCFSALCAFVRTIKKLRYIINYKLVLRKCISKHIQENDDEKTYFLIFTGFMDSLDNLITDVPEKIYNSTEVGDLYYLATSKKHNQEDYDIAAYFRESEWRLE